jgi:hypothetical protein
VKAVKESKITLAKQKRKVLVFVNKFVDFGGLGGFPAILGEEKTHAITWNHFG